MRHIYLLILTLLATSALGSNQLFLRSSASDWEPVPMQCSYRYGLLCKEVVTLDDKASLKFDFYGDWSRNLGGEESQTCMDTSQCQGRLLENGANIRLKSGSSYLVSVSLWGENQFSVEEIPYIAYELESWQKFKKLHLVSTSAGYGSKGARISILVDKQERQKKIGLRYKFGEADTWTYREGIYERDLGENHEIWTITFSGYGHATYEIFLDLLDDQGRTQETYWDENTYSTRDDF